MHHVALDETALAASPVLRSRLAAASMDRDLAAGWLQRAVVRSHRA